MNIEITLKFNGFVSIMQQDYQGTTIDEEVIEEYARCIVRYRNNNYRDGIMRAFDEAQEWYTQDQKRRDERQTRSRRRRSTSPTAQGEGSRRRDEPPPATAPTKPEGPHIKVAVLYSRDFRSIINSIYTSAA
jgi:hypothetical protein